MRSVSTSILNLCLTSHHPTGTLAKILGKVASLSVCLVLYIEAPSYAQTITETKASPELIRWQNTANNISISRDKWGIPHVTGKTDADAVFGLLYAQAEDDFNRIELNYINALGRLAEVEGEAELWRDLRMKMFINPNELQAKYKTCAPWLTQLMVGFADGLNFYLYTHPEVKPRLITHFEP